MIRLQHKKTRGEEGVALLASLVTLTTLIGLAGTFIVNMQIELQMAEIEANSMIAHYTAVSGINEALARIADGTADSSLGRGIPLPVKDGEDIVGKATVTIRRRGDSNRYAIRAVGNYVAETDIRGARDLMKARVVTIEATAARGGDGSVRLVSWAESATGH